MDLENGDVFFGSLEGMVGYFLRIKDRLEVWKGATIYENAIFLTDFSIVAFPTSYLVKKVDSILVIKE